jgi:predicted DNA-binding WGR domain protein
VTDEELQTLVIESWLLNLTEPSQNKDKFYRLYYCTAGPTNFRVAYHHGRNGTKGNYKAQTFPSQAEAMHFINDKLFEKEQRKGYSRIAEGRIAPTEALLNMLGLAGINLAPSANPFELFLADANRAIELLTGPIEEQALLDVMALRERWARLQTDLQQAGGWMDTVEALLHSGVTGQPAGT